MAFSVVQAGTALKMVSASGVVSSLTLPTGVTLRTNVPPRWAVFDRYVVLVNTPSQPLIIDGFGTVRLLCPRPPRLAPILTGPNAGTLSGTYAGVRYTFLTTDVDGNIISESDMSPASNSVTIATKKLLASGLDLSPDQISARRLYRPTTDGAVLFQWVDLDGNTLTSVQDDLSDAGLALTASPMLGTPPHLTHVAEFRGRLFGASDDAVDSLRYSEAESRYAWPDDNEFIVQPAGSDLFGITGLIGRRDALGVGRANQLLHLTGTGAEDSEGNVDFDLVILSKQLGVKSQESVAVYRDTAYFLWEDGVYSWGSDGLQCLSDGSPDGRGNVRSWFTTDSYFDRGAFTSAFAIVDPVRYKYRLFLDDPDGNKRWVEFDLKDRTWWGPHKTGAFTPKSAFVVTDSNDTELSVIGSEEGSIYQEQETRTDGTATAIEFDIITKKHDLGEPTLDKYWGQLALFGDAQPAGHLICTSRAGELNATENHTQYYNMTQTRQQVGRLGEGKHVELEFTHATVGQQIQLFGYEIADCHVIGKR